MYNDRNYYSSSSRPASTSATISDWRNLKFSNVYSAHHLHNNSTERLTPSTSLNRGKDGIFRPKSIFSVATEIDFDTSHHRRLPSSMNPSPIQTNPRLAHLHMHRHTREPSLTRNSPSPSGRQTPPYRTDFYSNFNDNLSYGRSSGSSSPSYGTSPVVSSYVHSGVKSSYVPNSSYRFTKAYYAPKYRERPLLSNLNLKFSSKPPGGAASSSSSLTNGSSSPSTSTTGLARSSGSFSSTGGGKGSNSSSLNNTNTQKTTPTSSHNNSVSSNDSGSQKSSQHHQQPALERNKFLIKFREANAGNEFTGKRRTPSISWDIPYEHVPPPPQIPDSIQEESTTPESPPEIGFEQKEESQVSEISKHIPVDTDLKDSDRTITNDTSDKTKTPCLTRWKGSFNLNEDDEQVIDIEPRPATPCQAKVIKEDFKPKLGQQLILNPMIKTPLKTTDLVPQTKTTPKPVEQTGNKKRLLKTKSLKLVTNKKPQQPSQALLTPQPITDQQQIGFPEPQKSSANKSSITKSLSSSQVQQQQTQDQQPVKIKNKKPKLTKEEEQLKVIPQKEPESIKTNLDDAKLATASSPKQDESKAITQKDTEQIKNKNLENKKPKSTIPAPLSSPKEEEQIKTLPQKEPEPTKAKNLENKKLKSPIPSPKEAELPKDIPQKEQEPIKNLENKKLKSPVPTPLPSPKDEQPKTTPQKEPEQIKNLENKKLKSPVPAPLPSPKDDEPSKATPQKEPETTKIKNLENKKLKSPVPTPLPSPKEDEPPKATPQKEQEPDKTKNLENKKLKSPTPLPSPKEVEPVKVTPHNEPEQNKVMENKKLKSPVPSPLPSAKNEELTKTTDQKEAEPIKTKENKKLKSPIPSPLPSPKEEEASKSTPKKEAEQIKTKENKKLKSPIPSPLPSPKEEEPTKTTPQKEPEPIKTKENKKLKSPIPSPLPSPKEEPPKTTPTTSNLLSINGSQAISDKQQTKPKLKKSATSQLPLETAAPVVKPTTQAVTPPTSSPSSSSLLPPKPSTAAPSSSGEKKSKSITDPSTTTAEKKSKQPKQAKPSSPATPKTPTPPSATSPLSPKSPEIVISKPEESSQPQQPVAPAQTSNHTETLSPTQPIPTPPVVPSSPKSTPKKTKFSFSNVSTTATTETSTPTPAPTATPTTTSPKSPKSPKQQHSESKQQQQQQPLKPPPQNQMVLEITEKLLPELKQPGQSPPPPTITVDGSKEKQISSNKIKNKKQDLNKNSTPTTVTTAEQAQQPVPVPEVSNKNIQKKKSTEESSCKTEDPEKQDKLVVKITGDPFQRNQNQRNHNQKRIRFREYSIDDFQLLTVLGRGSFGKVLLAELINHECHFAIKCLKKQTVIEDDDVESIMIERKVLAYGTSHPFICKLFCTFQTQSHLFFAMELCSGGDLMFHVQKEGKFPEAKVKFYASEILCAIWFLHKRGIIYRDLKLDNVMVANDGHIRLVDFGMCVGKMYREEFLPSNFCGTPEYMAPEIIKGVKYNHSVDYWALGVVIYEMCVGTSPFHGTDEDELLWNVCNTEVHYPKFLSEQVKTLCVLLLKKNPKERLGMPECPYGEIVTQPWFHGVQWDLVEKCKLKPPFIPQLAHDADVSYFDQYFTKETPCITPCDKQLDENDQLLFQGFNYTNHRMTD